MTLYSQIMLMATKGNMTKDEIKLKLGLTEKDYKAFTSQILSETIRKKLGSILSGNTRNKSIPKFYFDVSYRSGWSEDAVYKFFLGKGKLYETATKSMLINELSISELFAHKEEYIIICGSASKAELYKRHGFKTMTYDNHKKKRSRPYVKMVETVV